MNKTRHRVFDFEVSQKKRCPGQTHICQYLRSYLKCLLNKLLPEIKRDDNHGVNVRFTSAI